MNSTVRAVCLSAWLALLPATAVFAADDDPPDPTHDGVEVLLGIGSRILGKVTDYQASATNVLEAKTIGRATPQAIVGLGFPVCSGGDSRKAAEDIKGKRASGTAFTGFNCSRPFRPLSAFVSAGFGAATSKTINSYTIGMGYHVSKYLHALVGFSLAPVSEPAEGFRRAAAQYVIDHPKDYANFSPSDLRNNKAGAFDGFQYATSSTPSFYPGNPLATHYRGGLFVGVAFPLTLRTHLQ